MMSIIINIMCTCLEDRGWNEDGVYKNPIF
jgi:hypothetical protein